MKKPILSLLAVQILFVANSYAADTLYSRVQGTKCVRIVMDVDVSGNYTFITTDLVNQPSIIPTVYVKDGANASGNVVSVTNSTGHWWYIPFDSSFAPVSLCISGGSFSGSHHCKCKKEKETDPDVTGTCVWSEFGDGTGDCTSTDCTGCCEEETLLALGGGTPFSFMSTGIYVMRMSSITVRLISKRFTGWPAWLVLAICTLSQNGSSQTRRDLSEQLRRLNRPPTALEMEAQFLPIGQQAPDLSGILALGDSSLAFHPAGKLLLLEFWFASCPFCHDMARALSRIDSSYREQGLSIIGVNPYDWDTSKIEKFWRDERPSYPGLMVTHEAELDYGIAAYPMIYLLDERRRVIYRLRGYDPRRLDELVSFIAAHLK